MSSNVEEDDYFLKWEKHHSAFISYFSTLFKRSMLVDCTLAAEDKYIKAHRMVLMACSPYFEELLSDHCDNFPIVFLDVKFSELKAIVDFCYRGEVKVSFHELDGFLKAANTLQIRGLSKTKSTDKPVGTTPCRKYKRRHSSNNNSDNVDQKNENEGDISGVMDISESDEVLHEMSDGDSSEPNEGAAAKKRKILTPALLESLVSAEISASEENQGSDISDIDTDDDSESSIQGDIEDVDVNELLMQATGSLMFPWSCNKCGEAFATRKQYQDHRKNCFEVPADHPWKCEQCPNTYKNKKDLIRHLNYCGKEQPRLVCERCNNTYKYYRGLKRHQQYCGTDVKPLKCPECDKTYKYKRGLRRHQRKCVIFRALTFLQERGVNPLPQELKQEKEKRSISSLATLVCACGKGYKYARSFQRHKSLCTGAALEETSKVEDDQLPKSNDNEDTN